MKKSVLVLSAVFPPHIVGGAEISTFNMAKTLQRAGYDVNVLTMAERNEPEIWGEVSDDHLKMYRIHFPKKETTYSAHQNAMSSLDWKIWHAQDFLDFRMGKKISALISEVQPTFVFVHLLDGIGFTIIDQLEYLNPTFVVFLHDFSLICTNASMYKDDRTCTTQCTKCKISTYLKNHFLSKPKNLIYVSPSQSTLDTVRQYLPDLKERRAIVSKNLPDNYHATTNERVIDQPVKIVYAGRIHPSKGVDFLLDVLDSVPDYYKFEINIFGQGEDLAKLKEKYEIRPWVVFRGFVQRDIIESAISNSDIVCTPSLWPEVYGRVTAQALMMGVPVFGSSIGGTTELVRDGVTGRLLPPGDKAAWKNAFIEVFESPSKLAEMKLNTTTFREEFNPDIIVRRLIQFLEQ